MYAVNHVRASSVADAAKALTGEAKPLAGGQTILPIIKLRLANPGTLVDLSGIGELKGIRREGQSLTIGAMTTHAEVAASPRPVSGITCMSPIAPTGEAMRALKTDSCRMRAATRKGSSPRSFASASIIAR